MYNIKIIQHFVVRLYNGILLNHKNEENLTLCGSMEKVVWREIKPVRDRQIPYDFTHVKANEQNKLANKMGKYFLNVPFCMSFLVLFVSFVDLGFHIYLFPSVWEFPCDSSLLVMNSVRFCLSGKVLFHCHYWRIFLLNIEFLVGGGFSLFDSGLFVPLCPGLHILWWEVCYHSLFFDPCPVCHFYVC